MTKKINLIFLLGFLPLISIAGNLNDNLKLIHGLAQTLIIILLAFAVLFFVFGILKYIRYGDNEEKRTEGKNFMVWGIISIFVIVSMWGLVNVLYKSFALDPIPPNLPNLPSVS